MNEKKINGALWGSFCADAYSLGPHWEYNTKNIEKASLDWSGYNDPLTKYHKGKKAGSFTHYGDQTLWLLEHIASDRSFNPETFFKSWTAKMSSYGGYMDHASRKTLDNAERGKDYLRCGSGSSDISAAGRIAPLLLLFGNDRKAFVRASKTQAALTHNNEDVIQTAGFFAGVASELIGGKNIIRSIETTAPGYNRKIQDSVSRGLNSTGRKTSMAVKMFGQDCSVSSSFSGIIHLISKYTDNYPLAMEENCRAGGDSAARGMISGMILGIINGDDAIPAGWKENLSAGKELSNIISSFTAKNGPEL